MKKLVYNRGTGTCNVTEFPGCKGARKPQEYQQLLEGRAGNLTDLAMGMVLVEKTPAWLQVMHEKLKHLIISSEISKKKKKLG